jgi:hypothetical protein
MVVQPMLARETSFTIIIPLYIYIYIYGDALSSRDVLHWQKAMQFEYN